MSGVQKIDISSSTIFRTVLILLAGWFLYIIRDILLILIGAIVISSAIEPLANWLQRYKIPRFFAVILVYVALVAVLALVVTLLVPIVGEQMAQLAQSLPHLSESLRGLVGDVPFINQETVVGQLQDILSRFGNQLASVSFNVVAQTRNVFSGIFSILFTFVLALYLVIEENALLKLFRIIIPKEHHRYIEHAITRMQYKVGRWVLGQLTLALFVGVSVGIGLWLMGVRYALVFGLISGLLEVIPVIGPLVATIPGVLVAGSQSLFLGAAALVFYILVQQVESHVLIPNIMRKVTGLNPLVTIIAVLLGARLAGIVGVILSVPVATMISIFLADVFFGEEKT